MNIRGCREKARVGARVRASLSGAFAALLTLSACAASGLYFAAPAYLAATAALFAAGVLLLSRAPRRPTSLGPPVGAAVLIAGPLLLAALYAAHLIAGRPLSAAGTAAALLRWGGLAAVAALLCAAAQHPSGRAWMRAGWSAAGLLLAATGLAAVYGLAPLPFAVLRTADKDIAAAGARLGGLLQYPNTYGMVMAVFLLHQLLGLARRGNASPEPWGRWAWRASGALPLALCLLLAESRGAQLAAAVGWSAAYLLERRPEVRRRLLVYTAVFLGSALLLYSRLAEAELAPAAGPGLLELAAGWAGALLLARSAEQVTRRRIRPPVLWCLTGAWLAGINMLAGPLQVRPGSATLSSRMVMNQDAWKLIEEAPWWGQGGEGWRAAYRSIQSSPYVGSQLHNGYLNLWLETGMIGLTVYLVWLGYLGYQLMRRRSMGFAPFLVIVIHALIDLDMSFNLVGILLIWVVVQNAPSMFLRSREGTIPIMSFSPNHRWIIFRAISVAMLALSLFSLSLIGLRMSIGERLYQQALRQIDEHDVVETLQQSLAWNPLHPSANLALAERSQGEEITRMIQGTLRRERTQSELYLVLGQQMANRDRPEAGVWFSQAIQLDPYNRVKQMTVLHEIRQLALRLKRTGHPEQVRRLSQLGVGLYNKYLQLVANVEQHPGVRNDRNFRLEAAARTLAAELASLGLPPS